MDMPITVWKALVDIISAHIPLAGIQSQDPNQLQGKLKKFPYPDA